MTSGRNTDDAIHRALEFILELPPEEREAALLEACGGDQERFSALRSFLAPTDDGQFLGRPLIAQRLAMESQFTAVPLDTHRLTPGFRVGPYEIVREIGEGGMGTVYRAELVDHQFQRTVALKVIRDRLITEELRTRFLTEFRTLARLDHPNIARLHDGSVSERPPYFAMEYVDGRPITVHCDAERLPLRDRLRLFLDLCGAVQYAHREPVVHRDLKPGNIFVSSAGVVKLLDFGIAKPLGSDDDSANAMSSAPASGDHTGVMTPEYASPEQVQRNKVTTAADIYALGAVLYELMTGRRAHRFKNRTHDEIVRVITREAPIRPSDAVVLHESPLAADDAGTPESPAVIAAARATTPDALRRELAGDLDHIVLTALRKDPQQRYVTADALAEDVRRHLRGLPVRAHPQTAMYRARKFVSRHRATVGFAVAAAVLAIAGSLSTLLQARRATRAAAAANNAAAVARRTAAFLATTYESADPDRTRGARLTATEVLDAAAPRVEADLATEPEVRDDMRMVLASVYKARGIYEQATKLVDRALESRQERYGGPHPAVAEALKVKGELLYLAAKYGPADTALNAALEMQRATLGSIHGDVAGTTGHRAELMRRMGNLDSAEVLARQTLDMRRQVFGPEHPEVARALNQVGVVLRERGKTVEALPLYTQALEMMRRTEGDDHSDVLAARNNVAGVLRTAGQFAAAESLLVDALARYRRLYDGNHPSEITVLNNLAAVQVDQGNFAEAEPLFRRVLEYWVKREGEDYPYAVATKSNLVVVLYEVGKAVEAEQMARGVLETWMRTLGPDHPNLVVAYANLGGALDAQGRHREAEPYLRQAMRVAQQKLSPSHARVASVAVALAHTLVEQHRCTEIEAPLREIIGTPVPARLEPERRVGYAQVLLGRCALERRDYGDAERLLLAGLQSLEDQPRRRRDAQRAARALVALYEATGRLTEAERWRAAASPS
jgi:eukaryotic-like serine/threonine-protein kinase